MYKGGIGQTAYILHRFTGLAVLLFLMIHIIDTLVVRFDPEAYNRLVEIYRAAWFKPFEVGLAASVLFHALNGVRIIIIDLFDIPSLYHKRLFTAVVILFFLLLIPGAYFLIRPILGTHGL